MRLASEDAPHKAAIDRHPEEAGVLVSYMSLDEDKLATLDRRHFSILRPRHVGSLRLLPE